MNKIKIIATLLPCGKESLVKFIEELMKEKIFSYRFNLAKLKNDEEIGSFVENLRTIRSMGSNECEIILDVPYPGRKPRILMKEGTSKGINNKDLLRLGCCDDVEDVYVDIDSFGNSIREGDVIYYGDGQGAFEVQSIINSKRITIKALNDFTICASRPICGCDLIKKNVDDYEKIKTICDEINPDKVMFSFVEGNDDVKACKKIVNSEKAIYKIETPRGVDNILEILEWPGDIMIGRGDLGLFSGYTRFYDYQMRIIDMAKKMGKKFFVATEILNSIRYRYFPTRADIVDASIIVNSDPAGIILTNDMFDSGKYKMARKILDDICNRNNLDYRVENF